MTEDLILIRRAQKGDTAAFRSLMERYQDRLYYLVLGMVNHKEDTEDLLQEIFIKVFKALPRFRGDSQVGSWMHRKMGQILNDAYSIFSSPKIIRYASVLGVLFVGIIIGRFFMQPQSGTIEIPDLTSTNRQFISAPLDGRSVKYLERSKMLLLSFSNFDLKTDGIDALNLSSQKKISQQLIREAEYLQSQDSGSSNKRFMQMVEESI